MLKQYQCTIRLYRLTEPSFNTINIREDPRQDRAIEWHESFSLNYAPQQPQNIRTSQEKIAKLLACICPVCQLP